VLAFLRDAKERPDEDVPRLVLADWLDEHGDESDQARAAFVRAQCRLVGMAEEDERRKELEQEARELEEQYAILWLGPIYKGGVSWSFRRGLVSLTMNVRWLIGPRASSWPDTEAWAWVEHVRAERAVPAEIKKLAACPALASLTSLFLDVYWNNELKAAQALAGSPYLSNLQSLSVSRLGNEPAVLLAHSPHLTALTSLDLLDNALDNDDVLRLLESPHLERLTNLALRGDVFNNKAVRALAACPRLANLKRLRLSSNDNISDGGLLAIASSPYLSNLTSLKWKGREIDEKGLLLLTCPPHERSW
jgi:uncharacterized protein (TIGR02996 family)